MAMIPKLTDEEARTIRVLAERETKPRIGISWVELGNAAKWHVVESLCKRGLLDENAPGADGYTTTTLLGREALTQYDAVHAKPERRGWVAIGNDEDVTVLWVRCSNGTKCCTDRVMTVRFTNHFWSPGHERWTGCAFCEREDPHEETECQTRTVREGMFEITFENGLHVGDHVRLVDTDGLLTRHGNALPGREGVIQEVEQRDGIDAALVVFDRGAGDGVWAALQHIQLTHDPARAKTEAEIDAAHKAIFETVKGITIDDERTAIAHDVTIDPDVIAAKVKRAKRPDPLSADAMDFMIDVQSCIPSEEALAKAMFVAANLDEIKRRGEIDHRFDTVSGHENWRCEVVTIAWNDPAYARQRREAESAAERVWAARKVVQR